MSAQNDSKPRVGIFLAPGKGRPYNMGRISAVFKADGDETQKAYSFPSGGWSPIRGDPGRTPTRKTTCSISLKEQ
jgi:hypothetical protein